MFPFLPLPRYTCIFQSNCASFSLHLILHMPHFFFLSHLASTCVLYAFMFSHPSLYLSLSHLLTYSRSLSLYFISSLFMSLSLSAHLLVMPLSVSIIHILTFSPSLSLTHQYYLSVSLCLSLSLCIPISFLFNFFLPLTLCLSLPLYSSFSLLIHSSLLYLFLSLSLCLSPKRDKLV